MGLKHLYTYQPYLRHKSVNMDSAIFWTFRNSTSDNTTDDVTASAHNDVTVFTPFDESVGFPFPLYLGTGTKFDDSNVPRWILLLPFLIHAFSSR